MKIHFLGGAETVTGANYLLEVGGLKVLIDCGLLQGELYCEEKNHRDFSFNPREIDYLFITHAHVDHIGRIPKLYKDGFRGKIIATLPTRDLTDISFQDSVHLMIAETQERKREPLYTQRDVEGSLGLFETADYGQQMELTKDSFCRLQDAGHILGSSIVEIWDKNTKIVFTGDLGNSPGPLLNPPAFIKEAEYLVIESAYGDRLHEKKEERKLKLERAIEDTVSRGGVLMLPAFAVERTQELLYELNELIEHSRVPRIPVFIDSPLAIKVTEVYKKYANYFNKETVHLIQSGDEIFKFPGLKFTMTKEESKYINEVPPPKLIIAGSGNSEGGRILYHEHRYLAEPKNTLLIIGYQVEGSRGRKILGGAEWVNIFGARVPIRCRVENIRGYSAHADQEQLYEFVKNIERPVKKVFVVQGEAAASQALAVRIRDWLGIEAIVPKQNDIVEL